MTQKIDVFISYKREERSLASQVAAGLEAAGYTQVTDLNLVTGDHFGDAIDRMIRDSRVILVLWTGASADSEWVRNEARLGAELKTYLGIMLEEVELPLDLKYLQCVNLTDGTIDEALPKIIEAVADQLGPPANTPESAKDQSTALNDELLLFQTVKRADDIETYQTFLKVFPKSHMAEEVRRCIKRLETFGYRLRKNAGLLIAALGVIVALLVGTLQFVFSDASSGSSILRNKLKIAQSERDVAKNQLNRATEKLVIVEKYTKSLSVEKNKLSIEIARLKPLNDQVKKLTLARNQAVSDKISIMIEREELSTELNHSLARIGNLIGEKGKLATEVAELLPLRTKVSDLSKAQKNAETKAFKAKTALTNLTAKLAKTEKELNDQNESIAATKNNLDHKLEESARNEALIAKLKTEKKNLVGEIAELRPLIFQVADLIRQVDKIGADLQAENKAKLEHCPTVEGKQGYKFYGICYAISRDHLELSNFEITELAGISSFTDLRLLNLSGTNVRNITPLQFLTNLKWLDLGHTKIQDFSPIARLHKLSVLVLDNTAFADHSLLAKTPNLQTLSLVGTNISNLTPIASYKKLRYLALPDGQSLTNKKKILDFLATIRNCPTCQLSPAP